MKRDWRLFALGAVLAILPDCDYFFYKVLDFGEAWHRTFTHSIVFAVVTGVVASALLNPRRPSMTLVYFLATLSHPILDILTSKRAGGVKLFWPFYSERVRFGFVDYYPFITRAPRPIADIMIQLLTTSAVELAVFAPILLATLWINRKITTRW
jgi:membrane-bound metal-dependent hydrolase YbcI (DUF457 family)